MLKMKPKKIVLLLLAVCMTFVLCACGKASKITGTWQLYSYKYHDNSAKVLAYKPVVTFTSDGDIADGEDDVFMDYVFWGYGHGSSYKFVDGKLVFTDNHGKKYSADSYKLTNNSFTFELDGYSYEFRKIK